MVPEFDFLVTDFNLGAGKCSYGQGTRVLPSRDSHSGRRDGAELMVLGQRWGPRGHREVDPTRNHRLASRAQTETHVSGP